MGNDGFTHYTMHAGTQSLREVILRKVQEDNDINAKYEQVGVGQRCEVEQMLVISTKIWGSRRRFGGLR